MKITRYVLLAFSVVLLCSSCGNKPTEQETEQEEDENYLYGYYVGYEAGELDGKNSGYENGYNDGFSEGAEAGWWDGYSDGFRDIVLELLDNGEYGAIKSLMDLYQEEVEDVLEKEYGSVDLDAIREYIECQ